MPTRGAGIKFQRFDYRPQCEPQIARGDEVKDGLKVATDALARSGYQIASSVAWETGDYAKSIHGELELTPAGWVGALVASDWKAHFVEWGTGAPFFMPAKHVLQRAVFATGLRFFEAPK
jgi:hypothetical protein